MTLSVRHRTMLRHDANMVAPRNHNDIALQHRVVDVWQVGDHNGMAAVMTSIKDAPRNWFRTVAARLLLRGT